MSGRIVRALAEAAGRALDIVYPPGLADWAHAMRCEIAEIENDRAALKFALSCLWGGCRESALERLFPVVEGPATMTTIPSSALRHPRNIAIACALAATCLGIFYLALGGAPLRYPVVNAVGFVLGAVSLGVANKAMGETGRYSGAVLLALAACLLATALLGAPFQGAARWIWIGPLGVQLSLVVLPVMVVAFALRPTVLGSVAIAVAAAALALQPDRAMAGVLTGGLAVLAIARPGRATIGALIVALAAFAVALAQPDTLPAVPYVDHILFTSFDVHPLAGAAVVLGTLLLLVPAIAGWRADADRGHAYLVFGAVWLGCIAAALLGNYPTPVVGYGGSAILGYLLSIACLPTRVGSLERHGAPVAPDAAAPLPGLPRSASLA